MKECMGDDGETYIELNGMWYRKVGNKLESSSKPRILVSCKMFTKDSEKKFFTKYLLKKKGEQ